MIDALNSFGAKIRFVDRNVGYVLVAIPREKLLDTLDVAGIAYAYTRDDNRMYSRDPAATTPAADRRSELVPTITVPYPRVAYTLSTEGPYFATDEIGLTKLWKEHPEADGRAIRVAVADEGFDLLHPALQQAINADGKVVPKVADISTLTTPFEDSNWVEFGDLIKTEGGFFTSGGRIWAVPTEGVYRFGIFKHDLVLGPPGNSHAKKLSLSVGVLWNPKNDRIWVDTNGDGNFRDQRPLGDYGVTHDVDWFGDEAEDKDNRIPFGVKIDSSQRAVYIRIGGEHGAFIAGALAGNRRTGGLFDGAAPNAQLVDQNIDRITLIASLVRMAARPDIDVINRSGGIGRAGYTGDDEGIEDFAQHVLERVIAVYRKPVVAYTAATGSISVNDYAGPEMLRRNRQLAPPYSETMNSSVWDLPNGFVNTLLAPSANLETDSRYTPQDILWADGKRHGFGDNLINPSAPQGYVIGANNSPTIPVVSGIIADLISEAKRDHVRYDAIRLNNAIFTSARLLERFPLSEQGYGLVDAANSWNQLVEMGKADDPANTELTSFAISRIQNGRKVEVQGFHAESTKPGEKINGEIWITRKGGYKGDRKYTFSLRGNNGDYELIDHEAILKRGTPVRVRFQTNGVSGRNVVFLELHDNTAGVVMANVPLSVRVPERPKEIAPGVDQYEATIPPLRIVRKYIQVGNEAQAARYLMRIPYTGPCCSSRVFPGARYSESEKPAGTPLDAEHHVGPMEELRSLVVNDAPGTQQFFVENRGHPEYATQYDGPAPDVPIHATMTVTKYAVVISKAPDQSLSIKNQLARIDGHVEVYDAKRTVSLIRGSGNHKMAEVERELPANLVQWRVHVTGGPRGIPTDAYLFNCTGAHACYFVSQQEFTGQNASLVVDRPHPGKWKIVMRARERVVENSAYKLTEAQLVPIASVISQADAEHESGEAWKVTDPVTAQYAAFRIAGTPGVKREKDGLLIAMTSLASDLP